MKTGELNTNTSTLKDLALESCSPVWEGKADTIRLTRENVTDQRVINLMKAIVAGPYADAFPIPSEQESAEDIMGRVAGHENPVQYSTASFIDINKAGEYADIICNSTNEKEIAEAKKNFKENFVGLASVEDYVGTNTALVAYALRSESDKSFVLPSADMISHAIKMIAENKKKNKENFTVVVWEANNPSMEEGYWKKNFFGFGYKPDLNKDSMTANSRIRVFENGFNATPFNLDYLQPPLAPDQESCHGLVIYGIPIQGSTDAEVAQALKKFLNEFYRVLPDAEKFEKEENANYMEKYANYCSERSNKIKEILNKDTAPEKLTFLQNIALGIKELFVESREDFIAKILLPQARQLSWDNGVDENFETINTEINKNYKDPKIRAEIFKNTLEKLQKELSKDYEGVTKLETQLNQIVNGEIPLYGQKLFNEQKYEQDSQKWAGYRKPRPPEIIDQKNQNLLSSKETLAAIIETIKSNNAELENESTVNPLSTNSQTIESATAPQKESSANANSEPSTSFKPKSKEALEGVLATESEKSNRGGGGR